MIIPAKSGFGKSDWTQYHVIFSLIIVPHFVLFCKIQEAINPT